MTVKSDSGGGRRGSSWEEEGAITGAEARGRGVDRHARTQRREVRIHRREAHARARVCVCGELQGVGAPPARLSCSTR